MKKTLLSKVAFAVLAAMFSTVASNAQSDGDYRTGVGSPAWATASHWQRYDASTQTWVTASAAPTATTNVTIREGHLINSSNTNPLAANFTLGEGDSFMGTATLVDGKVTAISVDNPGKFLGGPGLNIVGPGYTTAASAAVIYKVVGADKTSGGIGYDASTTVTIGVAWLPATAYAVGNQRSSNGNLYTVVTAGTSDATNGPSGTGAGITDGTVVWDYAGPAATATAVVSEGMVTSLNITNTGSGYTVPPAITITGTGTGASFQPYSAVVEVKITNQGVGYTAVPRVMQTYLAIGSSSNTRTMTVSGDVKFRKGVSMFSGNNSATPRNQTLIVGGNMSAESMIEFRMIRLNQVGNTNVIFNKAGEQVVSGAKMIFNDLTINSGSTLKVQNEIVVLGTLTNNGALDNQGTIVAPNRAGTGTVTGNVILGVELSSFIAKVVSHGVSVQWATSSETNSDKFIVERSSNGIDFKFLTEVKSKGASSYTITDNNPVAGINYYRLVQFDLNGTSKVYGPVSANVNLAASSDNLNVYPNPTNGAFSFSAEGLYGSIKVVLSDSQGRIVYQETISGTSSAAYKINPKQILAAGQYFLQVSSNGVKKSSKVIVF